MTDAREWAHRYLDLGLAPIPLRSGGKEAITTAWQKLSITHDQVDDVFKNGSNIGTRIVPNWVDVDLDCPEARALGALILPKTPMIHGRPTHPKSHYWYRTFKPMERETFVDIPDSEKKTAMLVEIRAEGNKYTMLPGSSYENEQLFWHAGPEEPEPMEGLILREAVSDVAAFALLSRHWPVRGQRHRLALAVAGALARRRWSSEQAVEIVSLCATLGGDEEAFADRARAVSDTYRAVHEGGRLTGIPTIRAILGDAVTDLWCKYLGIVQSEPTAIPTFEVVHTIDVDDETGEIIDADPDWRDILHDTASIEIENLPVLLQHVVRRFARAYTGVLVSHEDESVTIHDWGVMLALAGWSSGLRKVWIENLSLNLWFLGIARRGSTKTVLSKECEAIYKRVFNDPDHTDNNDFVQIFTSGSIEGLWSLLEGENLPCLIHIDEFSAILEQSKRDYARGLKFQLNSLYDGSSVRKWLTGKKKTEALYPHVALMANTVGNSINRFVTEDDFTSGFMGRIMICNVSSTDRQPGTHFSPDMPIKGLAVGDIERDQIVERIQRHWLERVRGIRKLWWECTMSSQQGGVMQQYTDWLQPNTGKVYHPEDATPDTDTPTGRVLVWAKKVAALLTLMDEDFKTAPDDPTCALIPEKWVTQAVYLAERSRAYSIRTAALVARTEDEEIMQKIERHLQRRGARTARQCAQAARSQARVVLPLLDLMCDAGQIRRIQSKNAQTFLYVLVKEEER